MNVGGTNKETSSASTVGGTMGATNEAPLAPNSSLVSVNIPIGSPPVCPSTGMPLATEPQAAPTQSSKPPVCGGPSTITSTVVTEEGTVLTEPTVALTSASIVSKTETKDSSLPKEVDPIQRELNGHNLALVSSVASSTITTQTRVPVEPKTSILSSKSTVVPSIPGKDFRAPNTEAMTTFSASPSQSLAFLSRPPPASPLSRPLPHFSSRPIATPLNGSAVGKFAYCSGGAPPTRPFNIPSRGPPSLPSPPMRTPVCGPGQGVYSSSSPGEVYSPTGAMLYPSLISSGMTMSLAHDSQARSYSFPRGPPPPSIPYGFGRNHSWPSETSSHSIPTFRPPLVTSSPIPPPFQSPYQGLRPRGGSRQPQTLRISKWVNPIPPDPDDGQQQTGEQELATKMLQIQSKRFYIDVKQNRRGRFMKVAEIGADGRRNQVFLALSTAAEFRDHLSMFSEFYSNLGPPNPDTLPEDGKLKSETMVKDNRRYYLDLKENSRGRFLRVSQTIARGGPRCQIAIPAQGMIEFRDALQELLEEFGTDDGGFKGELPEGRHMRVENKNFYFDIGQNNRGIYMRISEVKTNFRTAITIPEKSWSRFRDIFGDYVDKMKEGGEKNSSESNK